MSLEPETHTRISAALQLPPQLGRLLSLLMRSDIVSTTTILEQGIASDTTVVIRRLRQRLDAQKLGVAITVQYGVGYWISPDDKDRIQERIDGFFKKKPTRAA